ncbi:MerR family transcriptional regulator [Companilactobacillus mishanensis]|uniref:MerR family transcriptional regulator n=1 Tax=Companilactobacillus mishanensis TaxID=2486008 RepID=A0A5P0ZKV1_9LACO|nr:MerR family transcriptional regulator [Companilactobacillus mishanensis]MQS45280.1 MerR family transcriptional regulator [Companilactobacillus mishanensis]MQS53297.1 MerR family transcriptional regulator [Companilactobacillus mishanensis]MQS90018.1 MerR family transcriptional regulator [Companilactobacillus mishanensis]
MTTETMKETEKQYRIGDFAEMTGLTSPTLRYYEKEGLVKPHRSENGLRYYTDQDVDWIKFLLHLKGTGMSIEQLKKYVDWRAEGDSTIGKRLELLKQVKSDFLKKMEDLEHSMTILTDKIDWYQGKKDGSIKDSEDFSSYLDAMDHQE